MMTLRHCKRRCVAREDRADGAIDGGYPCSDAGGNRYVDGATSYSSSVELALHVSLNFQVFMVAGFAIFR